MKTENIDNEDREYLVELMKECLDDARHIVQEKKLLETQVVLSDIAIALFNSRLKKE